MLCGISQHITQKQCGTQILTEHSPSASSAFTSFISLAIRSKTCGPLGLTAIRCYTQLVQDAQAVSQSLWIFPTKQLIAHLQHWSLPQLLTNTSALHGILWPHLNGSRHCIRFKQGTRQRATCRPEATQALRLEPDRVIGEFSAAVLPEFAEHHQNYQCSTRIWTLWTPI